MLISTFFQKQRLERLVSGTRFNLCAKFVLSSILWQNQSKIKTDIFTFGAASMYLSFTSSSMKFLTIT